MEHSVNRIVDETMSNPGVAGVMCVDEKGLCLSSKGKLNSRVAGLISGITQQASKLHSDIDRMPVVALESDSGSILIKFKDRVTVAVHKNL
ncbi:ragulator complex protein LAMTOR5-like [Lineus longissimus]|uniref:ragulator complex protein LAMTOR5-like n=1 Tax=Lineus longissimus TaxID=88925 RepID=UPI002B4C9992